MALAFRIKASSYRQGTSFLTDNSLRPFEHRHKASRKALSS
jgi:hypothetical protein